MSEIEFTDKELQFLKSIVTFAFRGGKWLPQKPATARMILTQLADEGMLPEALKLWPDRANIAGGQFSDEEVANKTAMLMRTDFDHEAVLTMARDRIRYLSGRHSLLLARFEKACSDLKSKTSEAEKALQSLVTAWESLKEGNHSPSMVESWLKDDMLPAVTEARKVLK